MFVITGLIRHRKVNLSNKMQWNNKLPKHAEQQNEQ